MGYYGLALNVGSLVGNIHVNNLIGGLVEVPAYLLLLGTMKVGRKWPYVGFLLIGGAALVTSAFLIVYMTTESKYIPTLPVSDTLSYLCYWLNADAEIFYDF